MTRPIPAALLAVLTGSPLAGECAVLRARDGTTAGMTTLDLAQTNDLTADGGPGPVSCAAGMVLTAVTLSAGLDASFAEVQGPLGPLLTREAVEGGKWSDAEVWLVRVSPGTAGYAPMLYGKVREARVEDPRFVLEVRNQADDLGQQTGVEMSPYCRADLGDAKCGFALVGLAATVTGVTDAMRFALSYAGTFATDHFNRGKLTFTSGALIGVISENLFKFTSAGAGAGSLVLLEPLAALPAVADTLNLFIGCGKTRAECLRIQGTALTFRGEPDYPGTEQLVRPANPGGG